MLVNVTQEHITQGKAADYEQCPIALALRETFFNRRGRGVHATPARLLIGVKSFPTPRTVKRFMRAFDDAQPVKPFRFHLKEYSWAIVEFYSVFGEQQVVGSG